MFNAPNIKGPRFRKDYKSVLTIELYKKFIESNPQYKDLTYDQFRAIIKTHSKKMWNAAASTRDGVELPSGGTVFVGSTKITKKNNYNIQASIAANRPIKHRNFGTDGYVAKIYYSTNLSKVGGRDRSLWAFKGGREFKRTVSREYPKNWNRYIVVADLYKIVREYKRNSYRNFKAGETEKGPQTYNEFDLN